MKYHGKCEKLHGHTYTLVVILEGEPDEEGLIMDFSELKKVVKEEILNVLDHSYINDVIEQPTAENIAIWVWKRLEKRLKGPNRRLYEVQIWETEENGVIYRGEEFKRRSG